VHAGYDAGMRLCLVLLALVAVGCGSGSSSQDLSLPADMTMSTGADMFSVCGHPGDNGNSKGVGKYCTQPTGECPTGTVCSVLMQPPQGTTYFCTVPCNMGDPNPNAVCAENATCTCLSGNACGCVPDSCRLTIFG
jgi:hypothetical protein